MKKEELNAAVEVTKERYRSAFQTIYDALNQGQKKKLLKDEVVKNILDLYGVVYEQEE